MNQRTLINFLNKIEKLKCNTRHSWTTTGRKESVAEHSWRLAVMAMLCADEFPELDTEKLLKMCLVHDLGEALTGDVPAFKKTEQDEACEDGAILKLLEDLPSPHFEEWAALLAELKSGVTTEAKLLKSLDNLEALISHNEADLASWLPLEYELNLIYGQKNCEWSAWTKVLREEVRQDSLNKISEETLIGDF
ncbi:MAG: HD domain-containing protein [Clostridia bacterium]|nr:HD domain-containing protein [Clostridia bacterium]